MPLVSVICPFLNGGRFLVEAVGSVLSQHGPDFELLLVDDGSTDGSGAIARQLAADHPATIRYLEHPGRANRGISASRNLALARAAGSLIAFIDADDRWRPGKLAEQAALLAERPGVGMVCGAVNYWSKWENGVDRIIQTGAIADAALEPPAALLALYPLGLAAAPCPSDVMVRRVVVDRVGGFENQYRGLYEDQAFFVKVYLAATVWFSSQVWLDYRQHADSVCAVALREGAYTATRRGFLDWLEGYLRQSDQAHRQRALRAIARARWRDKHAAMTTRARGMVRRILPA